jgi:hypothetical protein
MQKWMSCSPCGPGRPGVANHLIGRDWRRLWFGQRLDVLRGEAEDANRAGDVLHRLLRSAKASPSLSPDLIVRGARDADAARLAADLRAGGDIIRQKLSPLVNTRLDGFMLESEVRGSAANAVSLYRVVEIENG